MTEITYTQAGDCLLPNIRLSDPPGTPPLGRYGTMHKVVEMKWQLSDVCAELKKVDRRIETLKNHIVQSVNYKQCRIMTGCAPSMRVLKTLPA